MNKPDWKDAPEWANYLAMDHRGYWYWYENEPIRGNLYNMWNFVGKFQRADIEVIYWENSLEQRPKG